MSDETRFAPAFVDPEEAEAPTERDPTVHGRLPERGVALSTLWWLDSAAEDLGD